MRKYGEHSVEWEEISLNRVRLGALQIFLLFPQILYELWEKKNKVESVETVEKTEQL